MFLFPIFAIYDSQYSRKISKASKIPLAFELFRFYIKIHKFLYFLQLLKSR